MLHSSCLKLDFYGENFLIKIQTALKVYKIVLEANMATKKQLTLVLHLEVESGNNACSFKMRSLISSSVILETLALLLDITSTESTHTHSRIALFTIKNEWEEAERRANEALKKEIKL